MLVSAYDVGIDEYLDLARTLAAPVLYIDEHRLGADEFDRHVAGAPEGNPAAGALARHLDDPTLVAVAFAGGGVTHSWFVEADWLGDLIDELRQAAADHGDQLETQRLERALSSLDERAALLAGDAKFKRAPLPQRLGLARRAAADLPEGLIEKLADRASRLVDEELEPQARQLRAAGETKAGIAARLGVGAAAVDRYLA